MAQFSPKVIIPIAVLATLLLVAWIIRSNPPEVDFGARQAQPQMTVETVQLIPTDYQVNVPSYGIVRPRIQSLLVAQVAGQVVAKSPNFDEGGYFSKGDVMLSIDPRDYEADVQIAAASLADAQQALLEEQARAEQARIDWERLGNEGDAPVLVLRKPQLAAAEARVTSADANLTKARLDLERTQIRAPFDGRVLRQIVDLGQVVSNNSQLAEFYSTDIAEVRLPIANKDLGFVILPESSTDDSADSVRALLYSDLAVEDVWESTVVRTEAAIDDSARQLHVLAHVAEPFKVDADHVVPLKIGQYVTASISGRKLRDVIVVPMSAVYQGSYVYTVEDGLLQRRDIDITWSNSEEALVVAGLESGDELVTTILGQVTSGTPVQIAAKDSPARDAALRQNREQSAQ
jgi:RND family efflux transporter MFP subunit